MAPLLWIGLGAAALFALTRKKPAPPNPDVGKGFVPGDVVRPKFTELEKTDPMTFPIGTTWIVEADVPWFAEAAVTEQKVRDGLRDQGLLPLRVSRTRPTYWPVLSEADWYVVVTNADKTKSVSLPSAVDRVWQAVAV